MEITQSAKDRQRYRTDPQYRESKKERERRYYRERMLDPAYREKLAARQRQLRKNPVYKVQRKIYDTNRYKLTKANKPPPNKNNIGRPAGALSASMYQPDQPEISIVNWICYGCRRKYTTKIQPEQCECGSISFEMV